MNEKKVKLCKKCGMEKSLEEMVRNKNCKDFCEHECKVCAKERKTKWYFENWDRLSEEWKERTIKYREKFAEYKKQYYAKNKEKISIKSRNYYLKCVEDVKMRVKSYYNTEHGRSVCKINSNRRRHRIEQLMTDHDLTIDQWAYILKIQDNKCLYCGISFSEKPPTVEHLIPVTKGGTFTIDNIRATCKSCNSSKHTKTHEEFLEYRKKVGK